MLIDRGYITKDGNLEVLRTPLVIDEENLDLIVNVINGNAKYKLPLNKITAPQPWQVIAQRFCSIVN